MFIADYHIHTNFSSDARSSMEDMILSAANKGLKEIAITDHVDFCEYYDEPDCENYIITFNALKEKYSNKINII